MADDRRQLHQGPSPQCRRSGRKSGYCPHQRGLNSKLHLAVDSHGMPVRLAVTGGTVADCSLALPLIEGIEAECLLADKAYDTNEIIATARASGMNPVIPPKSNRREKRDYDQALYKLRHWWRTDSGLQAVAGVATRYAKRAAIPGHLPTPGSDDLEQTLLTTPPSRGDPAIAPLQRCAYFSRASLASILWSPSSAPGRGPLRHTRGTFAVRHAQWPAKCPAP